MLSFRGDWYIPSQFKPNLGLWRRAAAFAEPVRVNYVVAGRFEEQDAAVVGPGL